MNGKTHQISGIAATLSVTYLTVKGAAWVSSSLPNWLASCLTPPPSLMQAGSSAATTLGGDTATSAATSYGSVSSLDLGALLDKPQPTVSGAAATGLNIGGIALSLLGVVLIGLIAGQFPDIDTPDSTIANSGRAMGRLVGGRGVFGIVVKILFWVVNLLPHTAALIANKFFGHRGGIIHGLLGLGGTSLVVGGVATYFWKAPFVGVLFFAGYFTHLVVDSFSKSGVKWLWPLTDKSFHIMPPGLRFDTGCWWHNALAQVASVVLIGWIGLGLVGLLLAA